jgi:hypothetical protein
VKECEEWRDERVVALQGLQAEVEVRAKHACFLIGNARTVVQARAH